MKPLPGMYIRGGKITSLAGEIKASEIAPRPACAAMVRDIY